MRGLLEGTITFLIRDVIRYRREVVYNNLKLAFPEKDDVWFREMQNRFYAFFSRFLLEVAEMINLSARDIEGRCRFIWHGGAYEVFKEYRGAVIMLVPHYGNWELAGLFLALRGGRQVVAVYKPLSLSLFNRLVNRARSRFGTVLVPMASVYRSIVRGYREKIVYVFIADQNPVHLSACYWTPFFGRLVPAFSGPEKIAMKWKLPVVYAWADPAENSSYDIHVINLSGSNKVYKEPGYLTALYMSVSELIVSNKPPYWLWTHRRWKHSKKFNPAVHRLIPSDIVIDSYLHARRLLEEVYRHPE